MKHRLLLILTSLFTSLTNASSFLHVDQDIKTFDDHINKLKSSFDNMPSDINDKTWVSLKIAHMVEIDQYMRNYINTPFMHVYTEEEKREFFVRFKIRWLQIDSSNTSDLKVMLKHYNWFTISEFNSQTDQNAWLLVQHADLDFAFQKNVLKILANLYLIGETSPSNFAYLYDRVAASWNDSTQRTLQRYGTQGTCIGEQKWEPLPIENPEHLDERRKSLGLEPASEYLKQVQKLCH